jgi:hypothetical protein
MPADESPTPLRVAGGVVLLQGLGLVVAGVVVLIEALTGHPHDRGTAAFLGGLVIFYGAVVLAVSRGLVRRRPWSATPSLMVEFFAVIVAAYNWHNLLAVSIVLLASAVVAGWGLLHPRSRSLLLRERH